MWFSQRAVLSFLGHLSKMSFRRTLNKHLGGNFLAERMREASLALLLRLIGDRLSV